MKVHEMLESKFFKKEHVEDGPMLLTMSHVAPVNVAQDDQPEDLKHALYFTEDSKPLVLNRTNIEAIASIAGNDTDDWPGKRVVLYNDPNVSFAGKRTGGIRIRAPKEELSDVPF